MQKKHLQRFEQRKPKEKFVLQHGDNDRQVVMQILNKLISDECHVVVVK